MLVVGSWENEIVGWKQPGFNSRFRKKRFHCFVVCIGSKTKLTPPDMGFYFLTCAPVLLRVASRFIQDAFRFNRACYRCRVFITEFITVAIVHALAVMSPGPDFAMVTRNSLLYTRRTGILTALGISLGIAVHVAYCLLGIGLVISRSILAFSIVKYLGAAYLIYIGYQSLQASRLDSKSESNAPQADTPTHEMATMASIRTGFLTNLLNPKATLFFLALFTQVIDPNTPKHIQALYGIEMMIITFVWFMLLALFFSNNTIRKRILRVQHLIERATGLVFILLGIKVALTTHE